MSCLGCKKKFVSLASVPEKQPDLKIPEGSPRELRGHDDLGNSTMAPCRSRYVTLVLEKDGTYRDFIICQNRGCPLFNILSCPCDCNGCPWRQPPEEK